MTLRGRKMQKKILIVEDEDILRDIAKDYLLNEGYEVLEAVNGNEAWRYVKNMKSI